MWKNARRGWLLLIIGLVALGVPSADIAAEPEKEGNTEGYIGGPPQVPAEDANDPEEPFDEVASGARILSESEQGRLPADVQVAIWFARLVLLRGAL